ncbi:MAG: division/cell wall cluster transcriptional repressor MraZ [bacterium]
MFRGSNEINMDAKGRMAIPARYRDALTSGCNGKLVATIDTEEKCLLIYPYPEWEHIEAQLAALPSFNPATRRMQRLVIGHARDLEMDTNGRVLVPPELRAHASLEKKVVLIGQSHRFELWSQENWDQKREQWLSEASSSTEIPEELRSLSL